MKSGGMSTVIRSYGSWISPATVRRITSGRLTVSSNPSRPDSGEVLTPNVIRSVGASTSRRGSGRGSAGAVSVSPIVTSGSPATDTMSLDAVRGLETRHRAGQRDRPSGLDRAGGVVGLLTDDSDALADADRAVANS